MTDDAWTQMRRDYKTMQLRMEAAEKRTKELLWLDGEREKLFQMLREQFDILLEENDQLRNELVILRGKVEKLKNKRGGPKKPLRPLDLEGD